MLALLVFRFVLVLTNLLSAHLCGDWFFLPRVSFDTPVGLNVDVSFFRAAFQLHSQSAGHLLSIRPMRGGGEGIHRVASVG